MYSTLVEYIKSGKDVCKSESQPFVPVVGNVYVGHHWAEPEFRCLSVGADDSAVFQNLDSYIIFTAHNLGQYEDGTIEWAFTTGRHFY